MRHMQSLPTGLDSPSAALLYCTSGPCSPMIPFRGRRRDHAWSQQHLSHYLDGDLGWRARRRLQLHAAECPDCSLGIRALRALVRLLGSSVERSAARPPEGTFDRVRADAARGEIDGSERGEQ
ncbi:MAG: zf-HC2 domain-containing protein [Actinobacteria bacterium]|nr:MAG: zf-HC2 domain-containing protein [Actinomycetota bacterium]